MKELLQIFRYIQRFCQDNLEALKIILEFLLVHQNQNFTQKLIQQKEKMIPEDFYRYLRDFGISPCELHSSLNWKKVFRNLGSHVFSLVEIERFIQAIALQKTILKFYDYATPIEINMLVCSLLDIQRGESVYSPCCGMGSWIFSLRQRDIPCRVYGGDIDFRLVEIARIIAFLAGLKEHYFRVADTLKDSSFGLQCFDKVFCHPPLSGKLNSLNLGDNLHQMSFVGSLKIAPEIPFLAHSLISFKKKAVFIIRSILLYKDLGKKFCEYLLKNSLLECVIELPKNIFPHQMGEFCLIVLSRENKRVFFMDIRSFFLKEGKYNRIINQEEILDIYISKQDGERSKLIAYEKINKKNLKPSFYLQSFCGHQVELKQFLNLCFRGQRIDSSSNKNLIECYEIGIKHFESYGFTNYFGECSLKSNSKKIQELRLAPYDILLSIRGVIPKVAIVGEEASNKIVIANAGILVLRIRSVDVAQALYLYCISKVGCETLSKLYQNNSERIGEREISHFLLPKDFLHGFKDKFESLCQEGERLKDHQKKIQEILGFL